MTKYVKLNKRKLPLWMMMVLMVISIAMGWAGCDGQRDPSLAGMEETYVKRVVDGDTFITGNDERVRLIGIDAPESVKPDTLPEPYGPEASAYVKELLEGKTVYMDVDVSDTDRFDRLLRYIYLADGTFVNEKLLEEGYARHVVFPPDVAFEARLRDAENRAKSDGEGLWGLTD